MVYNFALMTQIVLLLVIKLDGAEQEQACIKPKKQFVSDILEDMAISIDYSPAITKIQDLGITNEVTNMTILWVQLNLSIIDELHIPGFGMNFKGEAKQ